MTRGQFWHHVLVALAAPKTKQTRRAGMAWMQAEGGDSRHNPLNTSLRMPGSTTVNDHGVQNYVSDEQGIEATVTTLREAGHNYERIVRRLRLNAAPWAIVDAIIESDWGTGHEDAPGDDTVIEKVLDDIQHGRRPNRLRELEKRSIAN